MTMYDQSPGSATGDAGSAGSGDGTTEQARQAAATAADEGRHVAQVAQEEAQEVVAGAKQEVHHLLDDARRQVEDQSRGQIESLVGTLQGFADDLDRMVRGEGAGSGLAQDLVQQVGDRARGISSQIQGREPGELLDQAREFARRRPGTFLLGALAAGVVAGRLVRGAKDAHSGGSGPSGAPGGATGGGTDTGTAQRPPVQPASPPPPGAVDPAAPGTAQGAPLAGTSAPQGAPAVPGRAGELGRDTPQWGTS